MAETDEMIGGFAKVNLDQMSEAHLEEFDLLLDQLDIDLFNWIMGREPVPEAQNGDVLKMLIDFNESQ